MAPRKPINHDIADSALSKLSEREKTAVLKLMSRISEASYRRGFQQGARFAEDGVVGDQGDIAKWRYGHQLDKAPTHVEILGPKRKHPWQDAALRLDVEFGNSLADVGLDANSMSKLNK